MKKSIRLFAILLFAALGFSACKSKQKVVTIPNAHVEAAAVEVEIPAPKVMGQVSVPALAPAPVSAPVVVTQPEEVRDEKFTLDNEEKNTKVLDQKYHVVVGSFKNRDNAKGLQQTLNTEGNNAVIVINEHGMYRVLIASYPTYKEARTKINGINNRFPDAWVLIQKEN